MNHLLIIAMLIASAISAQLNSHQDIEVNISNIDNNEGKIMIGLYASEGNWLGNPQKGLIGKIEDGESTTTFKNIPQGVYAISVFHDENNNNDLDMNFMGIPKEDNGCSNNASGLFGPPKWKDAKFKLKDKTEIINIKL